MKVIGIAIIDQGVDFGYHRLKGHGPGEEVVIKEEDRAFEVQHPALSHGTNIASIIHHNAPHAKLLSVKLEGSEINLSLLCKALLYVAQRNDITIINISLGMVTSVPSENLRLACLLCHNAGKIIVAAAHHRTDKLCYPAAFPFVIGVGTGIIKEAHTFCYLNTEYITVLAKGIHQRILGENGTTTIRGGTSYATAAFSGILANLFSENPSGRDRPMHGLLSQYSTAARSTHYPMDYEVSEDLLSVSIPAQRKMMVFPIDDVAIQKLFSATQTVMIMDYPMEVKGEYRFIARSSNKKIIPALLSPKLVEFIDILVVGNFFKNQNLINIFFGYSLIDFFASHNIRIETTDTYVKSLLDEMKSSPGKNDYRHVLTH